MGAAHARSLPVRAPGRCARGVPTDPRPAPRRARRSNRTRPWRSSNGASSIQDPRLDGRAERVVPRGRREPVSELPAPLTALVGRVAELAELARVPRRDPIAHTDRRRWCRQDAARIAARRRRHRPVPPGPGVRLAEWATLIAPDAGPAAGGGRRRWPRRSTSRARARRTPDDVLRRIAEPTRVAAAAAGPRQLRARRGRGRAVVARRRSGAVRETARSLATSREPLAVARRGRAGAVPPLALPRPARAISPIFAAADAVALFCQRAARRTAGVRGCRATTPRRMWSGSAGASTASRSRWNSPPRGCARSARTRSRPASTTALACSPRASAPPCPASRRCGRRWTGATGCCGLTNRWCCAG